LGREIKRQFYLKKIPSCQGPNIQQTLPEKGNQSFVFLLRQTIFSPNGRSSKRAEIAFGTILAATIYLIEIGLVSKIMEFWPNF
jgi:hypothetical protein